MSDSAPTSVAVYCLQKGESYDSLFLLYKYSRAYKKREKRTSQAANSVNNWANTWDSQSYRFN